MLRTASRLARRTIVAAIAALAAGCATQPPVLVVDRGFPAADRARTVGKVSQPTRLLLHSSSYRDEQTEHPLLFWEIRKEGK